MKLSLTDMGTIWRCAGDAWDDLAPQVVACLFEPLQLTPGCEITLLCRQQNGAGQALPAVVFDVLRQVFAQYANDCERQRAEPSAMQLNFEQPGSFWLPSSFWHAISAAMLQQLLHRAPEALPAALLTRCLEHDLGL